MSNPIEARSYYLQVMKWRAGSAATYVVMAIDWRNQRASQPLHFDSAQELDAAMEKASAYRCDQDRRAMLSNLESEQHHMYVMRDVILTGEQLDALGIMPMV